MEIPKLEKRNNQEIIHQMQTLAASYTPQWNFDPTTPDMGAAVAMCYGEMLCQVIEKYNRTPEKNLLEFFSFLGATPLPPEPARGYVQFFVSGSENNVPGEFLQAGTELQGANPQGEMVVYSTKEPLFVLNSTLTQVWYTDSQSDRICCLFSGEETAEVSVSLDAERWETLQQHQLLFCCDTCDAVTPELTGFLEVSLVGTSPQQNHAFLEKLVGNGLFYASDIGFVPCEDLRLEGEQIRFSFDPKHLPVRITNGETEGNWFRLRVQQVGHETMQYLSALCLGTKGDSLKPEGVFGETGELLPHRFRPFEEGLIPYNAVYFVSNAVLSRKGSEICLEFLMQYHREPIAGSVQEEEIDWKYIMKKSHLKKPVEYEISVRSVVWEYFNGSGWVRLFRENQYGDVFHGENDGRRVKLQFHCPTDMEKVFLASGACYAIRARIVSVENYMRTNGTYLVPEIIDPRFSYHYAVAPVAKELVTENCMEQKRYARQQTDTAFQPFYGIRESGKTLYFCFTAPLAYVGTKLLFLCRQFDTEKNRFYRWEYYGKEGWAEFSCNDATNGLAKTGILTVSAPHAFVETEKFGQRGYWIRLRFEKPESFPQGQQIRVILNGVEAENTQLHAPEYFYVSKEEQLVCKLSAANVYRAKVMVNEFPDLSGLEADRMIREHKAEPVYEESGALSMLWVTWSEALDGAFHGAGKREYLLNRETAEVVFSGEGKLPPASLGENVKISYLTGNGASGNLPAGTELMLHKNPGLISRVCCPVQLSGGVSRESLDQTIRRCGETLRLLGRGCTKFDYESIVRHADRNVRKVRCLGGRNQQGEREHGTVTLVVLLKDMDRFPEASEKIRAALEARTSSAILGNRLSIVRPLFLAYEITLDLTISGFEKGNSIREALEQLLRKYFHLFHGGNNGNGWEIGDMAAEMDLYGVISNVEGIEKINSFSLTVHGEEQEVLTGGALEEIRTHGNSIPTFGNLNLSFRVE